ncbi:Arabinogalactan oligomer/maltooligosaccharide transport system substrate-binding protein OS=Streptomyces albaduncus OX=68172 GN=FHS32_005729 PE=3 SV=1 [Streptomyces griseoloalbus]
MRRGIAATALVASLALAATACGGDSDSGDKAGGPVTITWWDTSNATNEAPTYQALVKEFEAANKDIKVNFVNVPFDQAQNSTAAAAEFAEAAPPPYGMLRGRWTPLQDRLHLLP